MADISNLSRLVDGVIRGLDTSANTLLVSSIKIGAGNTELTQAILDKLILMEGLTDVAGKYTSADVNVATTPTYYTAASQDVEAHLAGIDIAISTAGRDEFEDSLFRIYNSAFTTRQLAFNIASVADGTTRTITMPNFDINLGTLANYNLSNLNSPTAVNIDLVPAADGLQDLGSSSINWGNFYTQNIYNKTISFVDNAGNTKGGIKHDNGTSGVTIDTATDAVATSAQAPPLKIITGPKTAGSGDSGEILLQTGTSSLGSRGNVKLDGNAVDASSTNIINVADPISDQDAATKKYVDVAVASATSYQGSYDAATNTPDLEVSPVGVLVGFMYTVTVAGVFFTANVEIGDVLIAEIDNPAAESDWSIVQTNLDAAAVKVKYESNPDTNAFTDAEQTKLGGIEALADVTDSTNVAAAGAVMEADTSTALMQFVIDEDNMASNLSTKVPTQQSVKKYVDDNTLLGMKYKGNYYAASDSPSIEAGLAVGLGAVYTVADAGTFFSVSLKVGDVLIAKTTTPLVEADWSIIQYKLNNSTVTEAGYVELATLAEVDAGTDTERAVTPASLATIQGNVTNLSSGDNADTLHSHSRLVKTLIAGEAFDANTSYMVRIALTGETAGRVYKADKDTTSVHKFYALGFIEGSGATAKIAADTVDVIMFGEISLGSADTNFASVEIGQAVHLLASGAFDAVSQVVYVEGEASYRGGMVSEIGKILVGNMQLLGIY